MKSIKVFAPASIGNVSCGFDVLGLAVQNPGDEVIITLNDSREVSIIPSLAMAENFLVKRARIL